MARDKGIFMGGGGGLESSKFLNSSILEKSFNCELKVLGQRGQVIQFEGCSY